jgi:hypothetical protein
MKFEFEKDASNATVNPLYIQKANAIKAKAEKPLVISYRWMLAFRVIFFLIIPICFIGSMEYNVVYSYIWLFYAVVAQTAFMRTITLDKKNTLVKQLYVIVSVSILVAVCINFVPDTKVYTEKTHTVENDLKTCQWYRKDEIPICNSYFGTKNRILGAPATYNGKSLTREKIILTTKAVNGYMDLFQSLLLYQECPMVIDLFCASIVVPCDESCNPSKISYSWCIRNVADSCFNGLFTEEVNNLQTIFAAYNFLPDSNDNEILRNLLNETLFQFRKKYDTKAVFCNNPNLFARSDPTKYNCTKSKVAPGFTSYFANKNLAFQIAYTILTIAWFGWLYNLSIVLF